MRALYHQVGVADVVLHEAAAEDNHAFRKEQGHVSHSGT